MLTILDVLEGGGFPPLIVAVATEINQGRVLGEVLAEAVKVGLASSRSHTMIPQCLRTLVSCSPYESFPFFQYHQSNFCIMESLLEPLLSSLAFFP